MKRLIIAVVVIGMLSISAHADYDCDTKYYDKVKKVKSFAKAELSDEVKKRCLTQLEKAYQLCKDGKKEQAREILAELREEHDFNMVFSTHDGN